MASYFPQGPLICCYLVSSIINWKKSSFCRRSKREKSRVCWSLRNSRYCCSTFVKQVLVPLWSILKVSPKKKEVCFGVKLSLEIPHLSTSPCCFFANGKYLCLQGGQEHKELKVSVWMWRGWWVCGVCGEWVKKQVRKLKIELQIKSSSTMLSLS